MNLMPVGLTKANMQRVLNTLEEIVASSEEAHKDDLLRQVRASRDRYNDDKLNLAIIGEFSCGKSTFVNALFQQEVLATDMQPTTAVPTYITWDNPEDDFAIEAYCENGSSYRLNEVGERVAFAEYTGVRLPDEAERLTDAVTTDNRLCDFLSKVEVKAPYNDKYKGIRLIDTPGVNPGAEGTSEHVRKTQEVLRDAADAAIIMFPADQVYTRSFERFIEENASHLLKHSIFFITKSDKTRGENGLKEIRDFVIGHLSRLGVKTPEVYCVSAVCALDAYLDKENAKPEEKKWMRRFEKTLEGVFESLASRRISIVHENVTEVAELMTKLLTDNLEQKRSLLNQSKSDLQNNSPEKMREQCKAILETYQSKTTAIKEKYLNSVQDIVGAAIEKAHAEAGRNIDGKATKDGVSQYLSTYGDRGIRTLESEMNSFIRNASNEMRSELTRYKEQTDACYRKFHLNVSATEVNTLELRDVDTMNVDGSQTNITGFMTGGRVWEGTKDYIDEILMSDSLLEGAMKTVGGLVALPFAVLGALFNALRSLDSIKSEAKTRIRASLEGNRQKSGESLKESITKLCDRYMEAAAKLPDVLVQRFSVEFEEAEAKFIHQQTVINQGIMQTDKQLQQLRSISRSIRSTTGTQGLTNVTTAIDQKLRHFIGRVFGKGDGDGRTPAAPKD